MSFPRVDLYSSKLAMNSSDEQLRDFRASQVGRGIESKIFVSDLTGLADLFSVGLKGTSQLTNAIENRFRFKNAGPAIKTSQIARANDAKLQRAVAENFFKTISLLSSFISRAPLNHIHGFRPFEMLAYLGEPDAAPGGTQTVRWLSRVLADEGLMRSAEILEVGCFTGISTLLLSEVFPHVVGIDIDSQLVALSRRIGKHFSSPARFELRDGCATGYGSQSFDAVVLTATLGFAPRPREIVREAYRVLRYGGLFSEFLYNHPADSKTLRDLLRKRVAKTIQAPRLHDRLRMIESVGFRLARIIQLPVNLAIDSRHLYRRRKQVRSLLTSLEMQRSPYLSNSMDRKRFLRRIDSVLFHRVKANHAPSIFLCVFEK